MNQSIADIVEDLKTANKRVQVIYAFNGTGKTRLSRTFKESLDVEGNSDEDEGGISHLSSKNIIYRTYALLFIDSLW